jgi:hypothetical protein
MAEVTPAPVPSALLDSLTQAKLHIDTALSNAVQDPAHSGSVALARALRAMDPTNTGCSNCSCGGGGGGSGCGSVKAI